MPKETQAEKNYTAARHKEYMLNKAEYMSNCVKRVEWFADGTVSKIELLNSLLALEKHISEIKNIIKPIQQY